MNDKYNPWPIGDLIKYLSDYDKMLKLVGERREYSKYDVRENILEYDVAQFLMSKFGTSNVISQRMIKDILCININDYPARVRPDIVLRSDGLYHICEIKSSRVDYKRYDNVIDNEFKIFLDSINHNIFKNKPWEVERDLIKLYLYKKLSSKVGSCMLLFVDAYKPYDKSWSSVFSDYDLFCQTMKTEMIRNMAREILSNTNIIRFNLASINIRIITSLLNVCYCDA